MTPNWNSPQFIMHKVPDYACNNSRRLSGLYLKLREQAMNGRWKYIDEKDIILTYNTYNGTTEVEITYLDSNHHNHHFSMQLVPSNGFGDIDEDSFRLLYLFDGKFDNDNIIIRSFADYLAFYLHYEGFDPTLVNCDKGISMPCTINFAYEGICKLVDITISHIKPLEWFYSKEPKIQTFDEAYYYLEEVKSRLQHEACNHRWNGVNPECFKLTKYEQERELSLALKYIVNDVWELHLSMDIAECDRYFDMFASFNCYHNSELQESIQKQLDVLFADFLTTLKSASGNTFVGCGPRNSNSISIQYFFIDDTYDLFCNMLDEIVPALQNFKFQLPLKSVYLTKEVEGMMLKLRRILNSTVEVITEEQTINDKLKHGYFER